LGGEKETQGVGREIFERPSETHNQS
jgi:hypothetical protein